MSESAVMNRRLGKDKPSLIAWCLLVAICLLCLVLIAQVVILVLHTATNSGGGDLRSVGVVSGNFATTITSCGFVQGWAYNDSFSFFGIQYAIPPVGQKRWDKSDVHTKLDHCWKGTYLAVERKRACWQYYRNGSYDGSEDCLYIDVHTPKLDYQNPLNVILFIGGENLNGGESTELQPSAQLAKTRNCVFVSVSIRRSVLGFLSLENISKKSQGNYGISDLLTSLRWVNYNIRHFGGNPESVTILGHQSGASIVASLLKSGFQFQTPNLAHRIWLSGGNFIEPMTLETAQKENLKFLTSSECESVACLFNQSPEELMENVPYEWRSQFYYELPPASSSSFHQNQHTWLVYDGEMLKNPELFDQETNNHGMEMRNQPIPVVIGSPRDVDASLEMKSAFDWNITEEYRKYLDTSFDTLYAIQVYHQYFHPESNHWQQFSAIISDYKTICPSITMSRKYFPKNLIYNYITTHKRKTNLGNLARANSDIEAIFGLTNSYTSFKDVKFQENLVTLFYTFVETGSLPERFSSKSNATPKVLLIDDRVTKLDEYTNCDLWKRYEHYKTTNNLLKNTTSNYLENVIR